jgi:putative endopeptidase
MTSLWRALAASALALLSFGAARADDAASTVVSHFGTWGYDFSGQDLAVPPGTNFFLYANGDWLKRAEIPADKTIYGNYNKLDDLSEGTTRKLIEDAAAGRSDDPDAAKIGAAYRSFMDETRAEQLDATPLAADLAAIRAEKTKSDVVALMGKAETGFQRSLFSIGIGPDAKAPTRYAVHLAPAGLGLPDRDYYLSDQFADKKAKYQSYAALMLGMIGWADPDINAKAIVDFETKLAEASWTRVERRDRDKMYRPMTVSELISFAPGFEFRVLLDDAGLRSVERVIVGTDTAFPAFARIFDSTPLETLKAWQAFHLANSASTLLSKRFVDAQFAFYGTTLRGQPETGLRWKRAVGFVNRALGESVGRMYVARHFPPQAKAKVDALVTEVVAAMHARIDRLDWMSAETKAKAQEKLSKLTVKIGYPSKWRDYGALTMSADDLYGNGARTLAYNWDYLVRRLNEPVDRLEWRFRPYTVNASYNPGRNDITFPAGILQPPLFDPVADPAINYGGIGSVIGHEITHGFDDQGRKSDGDGVLTNWWTQEDGANFKSRAGLLASQYDAFEVVKGNFVNGQLTIGENIADLGGILLALDAYHASLHGKEPPVLDGLTGDQRFFLGVAQVWRTKVRDAAAIASIKTDVHSPAQFRVNGPLRNIAAWYEAFKIAPGDPMYLAPEKRVRIW